MLVILSLNSFILQRSLIEEPGSEIHQRVNHHESIPLPFHLTPDIKKPDPSVKKWGGKGN